MGISPVLVKLSTGSQKRELMVLVPQAPSGRVIWPAALSTSPLFKQSITKCPSLPAWHHARHPMCFQFTVDFYSKPGVRRRVKNFRIYSSVGMLPVGSPS